MKKVLKKVLNVGLFLVRSLIVGVVASFLASALGEFVDKYIFPQPIWQLVIDYLLIGGIIVYFYEIIKLDNFKKGE